MKLNSTSIKYLNRVGDFHVTGQKVRVGDLMFVNSEDHKSPGLMMLSSEISMSPGEYTVFQRTENLGTRRSPDNRTMMIGIFKKSIAKDITAGKSTIDLKKASVLGVDSGTMCILNSENSLGEDPEILKKVDKNGRFLKTIDKDGVYTLSGVGDGMYDMYVAKKGNKNVGVIVDMYSPMITAFTDQHIVSPFNINFDGPRPTTKKRRRTTKKRRRRTTKKRRRRTSKRNKKRRKRSKRRTTKA